MITPIYYPDGTRKYAIELWKMIMEDTVLSYQFCQKNLMVDKIQIKEVVLAVQQSIFILSV